MQESRQRPLSRSFALGAAAGIVLLAAGGAGAADFLRGDVNSDGRVSISDTQYLLSWLFRGRTAPPCLDAADVDDSGNPDLSDGIRILNFLVLNGAAPSAPFPEIGSDSTSDGLDCAVAGAGEPIDDPSAVLEVLDAVAVGGDSSTARIRLTLANGLPAAGYWAAIEAPPGVIGSVRTRAQDLLTGVLDRGFFGVAQDQASGQIRVGYLASLVRAAAIPPGDARPIVEITVCVTEGTPAGDYPLTLDSGEIADEETGRAVLPTLVSATLTVLGDVTTANSCATPPPPPPRPVHAEFRMEDAAAPPGGSAVVPFIIRADAGVQGYAFSVDLNEDLLQTREIEQVWAKPADTDPDYSFAVYELNNRRDNPGTNGIDEGFIVGAAVFDFQVPVTMPEDTDNVALRFHLDVSAEAPEAKTLVRFLDGGRGTGQPVHNSLTALGTTITPEIADSFLFVDCLLNVLPDITTFIRGDANGDDLVDLSDAQTTLSYLFAGEATPHCLDAADANDDGRLNVSDPIRVLQYLYLGGASLPAPFPGTGEDTTADSLGCLFIFG